MDTLIITFFRIPFICFDGLYPPASSGNIWFTSCTYRHSIYPRPCKSFTTLQQFTSYVCWYSRPDPCSLFTCFIQNQTDGAGFYFILCHHFRRVPCIVLCDLGLNKVFVSQAVWCSIFSGPKGRGFTHPYICKLFSGILLQPQFKCYEIYQPIRLASLHRSLW